MTRGPERPDGRRYIQVACRACGSRTLVFGDRPLPAECARCKTPLLEPPPDRLPRRPDARR
jgi:ribosomal protein S27E